MSTKIDFLLTSETRNAFTSAVAAFAETNTPKVSQSYSATHWPQKIGFKFPEFVNKVINYYLEYCVSNNVYYTNNQETTFLGDPFFKFIYVKIKGTTEKDLGLRDHIWSIVSACMSVAQNNTTYTPFWKPASYLTTTEKQELITKVESGTGVGGDKKMLIAGVGIAAGLLLLMQG